MFTRSLLEKKEIGQEHDQAHTCVGQIDEYGHVPTQAYLIDRVFYNAEISRQHGRSSLSLHFRPRPWVERPVLARF